MAYSTQTQLTSREVRRYSRQLLLPEVGLKGQEKLKRAAVACVGVGGLGSPVSLYLAAAGVGRIGLIDFDTIDPTNLHRQVLYRTEDVGHNKLAIAKKRLLELNPEIHIELHPERLGAQNALEILGAYDVVVDGADNFPTRYLVADACVLLRIPTVWASIYRWEGQLSVFDSRRGPCYRCLFPRMPASGIVPSCEEGGVVGALPGVMGTLQATETIKLILGIGEVLVGRLLVYDAMRGRFEEYGVPRDEQCLACGKDATLELRDIEADCNPSLLSPSLNSSADSPGGAPARVHPDLEWSVSPRDLKNRIDTGRALVVVDVRQPFEWEICHLPGSTLMPLGDLPSRVNELDPGAETVVLCHHGPRSWDAARYLVQAGFRGVHVLEGGLEEWALQIDPQMMRY